LELELLEWRTIAPTAATLTVFVAIVVLGWSAGATVGPAMGAGGTTITEPGAVHPIASSVPAGYATTLEGAGVNASPEILAFTVVDDRPMLVRGADFGAFAAVSDARLVRGGPPAGSSAAVVGEELANRLDLRVGETIAVGGSTRPTVTRVRVAGVYAAPGPFDDQLLVSLPTARHLTGTRRGTVQFVRTDRVPEAGAGSTGLTVLDVSVPDSVEANRTVEVSATVLNAGRSPVTDRVTATVGPWAETRSVSVAPLERRTLTFTVPTPAPGNYTFRLLDAERHLRVRNATLIGGDGATGSTPERDEFRVDGLPERVPPNSTRRVRVVTAAGRPAANATIALGDRRIRANANGEAVLSFEEPGTMSVAVTSGNETTRRRVIVTSDARRHLDIDDEISPSNPSSLTHPTVTVRATNRWGQSLNRTVAVSVAGRTVHRRLQVPAGGESVARVTLPRLTPGDYRIRIAIRDPDSGERLATVRESLRVRGNDRLVAALAARGRAGGATSIETAIESVFGDLTLVLSGVVALAALMSVESIAATFAGAVYVRRRTLGILRATGAGPGRVLRIVLGDACRIAVPAIALATVAGYVLLEVASRMHLLTVFGLGIDPAVTPWLLGTIVLGAGVVILVGATVTTLATLAGDPARLVRGDRTQSRRSTGGMDRD
jgi:hypothetical protein